MIENIIIDEERVNEIIEKYKNGEIIEDEKGAGGFWDYALELCEMLENGDINTVDEVYMRLKNAYLFECMFECIKK